MIKIAKRINISFKETERDTKLLLKLLEQNDKSAYMKNCIEFYEQHKLDILKLKLKEK